MKLDRWSVVRIALAVAAVIFGVELAISTLDVQSFKGRNAAAVAMCESLTPGMTIADVQERVRAVDRAIVAPYSSGLVVSIPHQAPCIVELLDGRVRSSAVMRNG